MAVPLDQPSLVVDLEPRVKGETQLFYGLEASDSQELLLEGANEPLGAPVALRRPHEGG